MTAVTQRWLPEHLNIPIHFRVGGTDDTVDPNWNETSFHTPEPVIIPLNRREGLGLVSEVSCHSRVFFWGEGSDNALTFEWRPYLKFLIGRGRYLRALHDTCEMSYHHRRFRLCPPFQECSGNGSMQVSRNPLPPVVEPRVRVPLRPARTVGRPASQANKTEFAPSGSPRRTRLFHGASWHALFEGMDSGNTRRGA